MGARFGGWWAGEWEGASASDSIEGGGEGDDEQAEQGHEDSSDEEGQNKFETMGCEQCGGTESLRDNAIVICDRCDHGYHQHCLKPKLDKVPKYGWICPHCCRAVADAAKDAPEREPALAKRLGEVFDWMADKELPAEMVDAKLWEGAARGGWRVVPSGRNSEKHHHWLYLAPCLVGFKNRAAIFTAAQGRTRAARPPKKLRLPPQEPGEAVEDCGECKYCFDKKKFGGPGIKKQKCILKQGAKKQKCSLPEGAKERGDDAEDSSDPGLG